MRFTDWLDKKKTKLSPFQWVVAHELNSDEGVTLLCGDSHGRAELRMLYKKWQLEMATLGIEAMVESVIGESETIQLEESKR